MFRHARSGPVTRPLHRSETNVSLVDYLQAETGQHLKSRPRVRGMTDPRTATKWPALVAYILRLRNT